MTDRLDVTEFGRQIALIPSDEHGAMVIPNMGDAQVFKVLQIQDCREWDLK